MTLTTRRRPPSSASAPPLRQGDRLSRAEFHRRYLLHPDDGSFQELHPEPDGVFRGRTFPGLWLDPAALLAGDMVEVLRVLSEGLASAQHAALVAELQKRDPG